MLTGRLVLDDAEMQFQSGELVSVSRQGATGESAFFACFLSEKGSFSVYPMDIEEDSAVSMGSVSMLVMSAFRLADDWGRIQSSVLVIENLAEMKDDGHELGRLLRYINGKRSLSMAARLAKVNPVDVVEDVVSALEKGWLSKSSNKAVLPQDLEMEELSAEALSTRGRQALRARELDSAVAYFEAASALEPDNRTILQNLRRVRAIAEREN